MLNKSASQIASKLWNRMILTILILLVEKQRGWTSLMSQGEGTPGSDNKKSNPRQQNSPQTTSTLQRLHLLSDLVPLHGELLQRWVKSGTDAEIPGNFWETRPLRRWEVIFAASFIDMKKNDGKIQWENLFLSILTSEHFMISTLPKVCQKIWTFFLAGNTSCLLAVEGDTAKLHRKPLSLRLNSACCKSIVCSTRARKLPKSLMMLLTWELLMQCEGEVQLNSSVCLFPCNKTGGCSWRKNLQLEFIRWNRGAQNRSHQQSPNLRRSNKVSSKTPWWFPW